MWLPLSTGWESTRDGLQWASQVLGAIRVAGVEAQPHDLQYSLEVTRGGVTTGPLVNGVELRLNYGAATVRILDGERSLAQVGLAKLSQISLLDALLEQLAAAGKPVEPSRKKIVHDKPFEVDAELAGHYAEAQAQITAALRSFREAVDGASSPVVLWPHHFDVAFLRFTTAIHELIVPRMEGAK